MLFSPSEKIPRDKVFLVGGCVRDHLLGQSVNDKDYVVIDFTPKKMLSLDFLQVGNDFPVFIDPKSGEEYALARTEKKQGHGYSGFSTATTSVTLKQDLSRRDLTINAMAMDENGQIIDPFNGMDDIKNKIIRHVSPAFSEDPLRVLRVARFAARYSHLGFSVAPQTMDLMRDVVSNNELSHLPSERIWLEIEKLSHTKTPSVFFSILKECGALKVLMPEVDALYGVPQVAQYHPEIDAGIHTEMVCNQAVKLSPGNVDVLFAALTHDLGKALTPPSLWPKHHDHEKTGLKPLSELMSRIKPPTYTRRLAKVVCEYHLHCHRALESRTGTILNLFERMDAFRNPRILDDFLVSCEADKRGRKGLEDGDYPQRDLLSVCFKAAQGVSGKEYVEKGLEGLEIKQAIRNQRLREIKDAQTKFHQHDPLKKSTKKFKLS